MYLHNSFFVFNAQGYQTNTYVFCWVSFFHCRYTYLYNPLHIYISFQCSLSVSISWLCLLPYHHCYCVGPSYSPFSTNYGEKEATDPNLNSTFPQMYQSLHIPSTHSSSQNQSAQDNVNEQEYETDEFSSLPHQPPSLPLYAGGRYGYGATF